MSKFGNGDYEDSHSSMRWLGHITRRIGDEQYVDKRGYGSQDDITVVCDGWGILHKKNTEKIKPERCNAEVERRLKWRL